MVRDLQGYVYAVRIHEQPLANDPDGTRRRVRDFAQSVDDSYVFVRETDASRTHFQGWIRTTLKCQALRVRLKKAFPECVGNGAYSLRPCKDFDKYFNYILKGTPEHLPDVVCYSGIDLDAAEIQRRYDEYWETHEDAPPARTQAGIVRNVFEWTLSHDWEDDAARRRGVALYVCDLITAQNKPLNLAYARYVFNAVMYKISGDFARWFIDKMLDMN